MQSDVFINRCPLTNAYTSGIWPATCRQSATLASTMLYVCVYGIAITLTYARRCMHYNDHTDQMTQTDSDQFQHPIYCENQTSQTR
uniref:Uncharacterized protein n=1 Tax=Pristionchus pacificus TaxID=54126 RepID=A0A2A6CN59_PRIPA|eukprot:PDM79634.1 hypothetical protein PRIPAC_32213 [Pristionchus pacificus]